MSTCKHFLMQETRNRPPIISDATVKKPTAKSTFVKSHLLQQVKKTDRSEKDDVKFTLHEQTSQVE